MARKKTEGSSSGSVPPQAPDGEPEAFAATQPAETGPSEIAPEAASAEALAGAASREGTSGAEAGAGEAQAGEAETVGAEAGGLPGDVEGADAAADSATPTDPWARPAEPVAAPTEFPWGSGRESEAAPAEALPDSAVEPAPDASADAAAADAAGDEPPPETRAEARPEAHHPEDEHEEEGWSAATKALAFLLVLLGGAGLGIWAAPQVAPLLPAGMSGVAAWLTPGASEADARVAALEARIDAELAALDAKVAALPGQDAISGGVKAAADSLRGELSGQIAALRQQIASADGGAIGDRVGQLESALAGTNSQLTDLKGQIEAGAASLGADAQQGLDTYRAELEGMKAEVGRLAGSVSGLGTRFDAASTAAETRASQAEQDAATAVDQAAAARSEAAAREDLAAIRAALASGAPFSEPLDRLAKDAGVAVPDALAAAAATGVESIPELRDQFGAAAHAAIRASIQAGAGDGFAARARAFVEAQMAGRSLTPKEGMDPDAVLSRMEDSLRRDDLSAALAEAGKLPSEAKAALAGWLTAAQARADALAALAGLDSAAPAAN